jgi:hypothetical protein
MYAVDTTLHIPIASIKYFKGKSNNDCVYVFLNLVKKSSSSIKNDVPENN